MFRRDAKLPSKPTTEAVVRRFAAPPHLWRGRCSILLFLASLALPALGSDDDVMWGFQVAPLSFIGVGLLAENLAMGAACVAGAAANSAFLLAYVAFLWRSLTRFNLPTFRIICWTATSSVVCGLTAGAILVLNVRYDTYLGLLGFAVWVSAPALLAAAAWRMPRVSAARGFEVIAPPAAAVPAEPVDEAVLRSKRRAGWCLLLAPVMTCLTGLLLLRFSGRGERWALLILLIILAAAFLHLGRSARAWRAAGGRREPVLWAMLAALGLGAALPLLLWYPTATMLADAASRQDRQRVRFYLAVGLKPDAHVVYVPYAFFLGAPAVRTALYEAVTRDDLETADLLLTRGADPNKLCGETNQLRRPLTHAVQRKNPAMIALLQRHGARLDENENAGGMTQALKFQLHATSAPAVDPGQVDQLFREAVIAKNMESITYLHERGARVTARSHHDDTPLHAAVRDGDYGSGYGIPDVAVVRWLLARGADVNARNAAGETPLSLAVEGSGGSGAGGHAVIRLLLDHGADATVADARGRSPLHRAATRTADVAKLLLDAGAPVDARDLAGRTPLHEAAEAGPVQVVELLLQHGADVSAKDKKGSTPLHEAASRSVEVVAVLVDHGADVNDSTTPLLAAASWQRPKVLAYLLDHGAKVSGRDRQGWTALHYAGFRGNVECAQILLARGGDPTARANNGATPLGLARHHKHEAAVKLLERWRSTDAPVTAPGRQRQTNVE